jgi:hypothetical protein
MHGQQDIKNANCSEPGFLAEATHFPLHSLQMGSAVHPASFSVDTSGFFHAGKATDYETDYIPLSSTKV